MDFIPKRKKSILCVIFPVFLELGQITKKRISLFGKLLHRIHKGQNTELRVLRFLQWTWKQKVIDLKQ